MKYNMKTDSDYFKKSIVKQLKIKTKNVLKIFFDTFCCCFIKIVCKQSCKVYLTKIVNTPTSKFHKF